MTNSKSLRVNLIRLFAFGMLLSGTAVTSIAKESPATEKGDKAKTAVLTFKRSGGIAGFHDNLTIYNDMRYAVQAPPHRPTKKTRTGKLDDGQKESLAKLLKTFGKVEWSRGNAPGVADGMQEAITINGSGKKTKLDPGAPEFRQILELVTGILRPRPAR
jgi:hypothetical protein